MRPWIPLVLAFAAVVAAQGASNNVIDNPPSGIQATAGEPLTISWTNPSSGTITIKIQTSGDIQPNDGIVVAENIPNSGAATFNVPPGVPAGEVFVQIIDDSNPSEYNFSGGFQVQGATNTATQVASTASAISTPLSSASQSNSATSASDSSASASSSDSMSMSDTMSMSMSSSSMSVSASTASASSESASSESASGSSSARGSSRSSSTSASRTSSSAASAQSTTAPNNGAMPVKIQGGLMAAVFGAAALL